MIRLRNIVNSFPYRKEEYSRRIKEFLSKRQPQQPGVATSFFTSITSSKESNSVKTAPGLDNNQQLKIAMKNKLISLIATKTLQKSKGSQQYLELTENLLTDSDYRDILEQLHYDDNGKFHNTLIDFGLKNVSRYSIYSNQRATGKLAALKEYLEITESDINIVTNTACSLVEKANQSPTNKIGIWNMFERNEPREIAQLLVAKPEFIEIVENHKEDNLSIISVELYGINTLIIGIGNGSAEAADSNSNSLLAKLTLSLTDKEQIKYLDALYPIEVGNSNNKISKQATASLKPKFKITETPLLTEELGANLLLQLDQLETSLKKRNQYPAIQIFSENDYQEILTILNNVNGGKFYRILYDRGIKISRFPSFSGFSPPTAKEQIDALRKFLTDCPNINKKYQDIKIKEILNILVTEAVQNKDSTIGRINKGVLLEIFTKDKDMKNIASKPASEKWEVCGFSLEKSTIKISLHGEPIINLEQGIEKISHKKEKEICINLSRLAYDNLFSNYFPPSGNLISAIKNLKGN